MVARITPHTRQLAMFSGISSLSVLVVLGLYTSLEGPKLTKDLRRQWNPGYSHYTTTYHDAEFNSTGTDQNKMARHYPGALIIGFTKCGTSPLKSFLTLHPNIVSPRHAVRFFTDNYDEGLKWYRDQMPLSLPSQITIEKSASYINSLVGMRRIREYNPNVLLLVIVRDPIVRLQSEYARVTSTESRPMPFTPWLGRDWKTNEHFLHLVDYASPLENVYRLFSEDRILVLSDEDLETRPIKVLEEVGQFLGLEDAFYKNQLVFNKEKGFYCFNTTASSYARIVASGSVVLNVETGCFGSRKGRKHPEIDSKLLKEMVKVIQPMNERLFSMIGKRFDWENFPENSII